MSQNQPTLLLRQIGPYLVVIVAVSLILAVAISYVWPPSPKALGLELIKATVQIATVLVLGQVVTTIVRDREHLREVSEKNADALRARDEARKALRAQLLAKMSEAFVIVKNARRLLRARALSIPWQKGAKPADGTLVLRDPYDRYMQLISATELELESLWHQIESSDDRTNEDDTLIRQVKAMKNYLRRVIHEYEERLPVFENAPSLNIAKFANDGSEKSPLLDLLSPEDASDFRTKFVSGFHDAAFRTRSDLLQPKSPTA